MSVDDREGGRQRTEGKARNRENEILNGPAISEPPLYAAFYANLDPTRIPTALDDESSDEDLPAAMVAAYISLTALKDTERVPTSVLPHLWPRAWEWMQFLYTHYYHLQRYDSSLGDTRLDLFFLVMRFRMDPDTAKLVDSTAGVHTVVGMAWRIIVERAHRGDDCGMPTLCAILRGYGTADDPAINARHMDELIDGAGGSVDDLASLVVRYVNLSVARTDRTLLALESVLSFLIEGRFHDPLWAPAFVSAGILKVLINAQRRHWTIKALKTGLLRAIISCDSALLHLPSAQWLLTTYLPSCTVHYNVLHQMHISLSELGPHTTPTVNWIRFVHLVEERTIFLGSFSAENRTSSKACDNIECGVIQERTNFRRCSRSCQRADWRSGHRNVCQESYVGFSVALYSEHSTCTDHWRTLGGHREREFLCALLHDDYLYHRHDILRRQAEFMINHPDDPFYTWFDYTSGQLVVDVVYLVGAVGPYRVEDDWYTVDQLVRATRSNGRVNLHRVFIRDAGALVPMWIPLRSKSGRLYEGLRDLATNLNKMRDKVSVSTHLQQEIAKMDAGPWARTSKIALMLSGHEPEQGLAREVQVREQWRKDNQVICAMERAARPWVEVKSVRKHIAGAAIHN
ncbi:hypothetical protein B0H13DRAFT_1857462 [Mycena leptocephala]|nr:hypothetical protein B0H13DRAFT_1857462 [Mycena leptocephala]